MGGIGKYDHVTPALKQLKWLKITNKRLYDICLLMFKILRNKLPEWLYTNIFLNNVVKVRQTRQNQDLYVKRVRTDMGSRMVSVRGPVTWNSLPEEIKQKASINVFREKLKEYFLDKQR